MIWIFALGIIGFCIVSAGFRKLIFALSGVVAAVAVGTVGYFMYQDHLQKLADEKATLGAASYPLCAGKDQTQSWLDSGGKCRMTTGDAEIDAAFPKEVSNRYAACVTKPFDPDMFLACKASLEGKTTEPRSSVDDIIPPSSLGSKRTQHQ
jgi:hypothetical protein